MTHINNKLKKAVQKSLEESNSPKPKDIRDYLGIPKTNERPKEIIVYKIWYHNRARLDHTKFPHEKSHPVQDSPMFATWQDADKYAKKLERSDKENMYWGKQSCVPITEIPKKIQEKIKKRGW